MPENKSSKKEPSSFPLVPLMIICIASAVFYFGIIALITAVALGSSVDGSMYLPLSIGAGAVSGFICGFVTAKITKEKGLLYGGLSGFLHSLLCSVVIFVLNKGVAGNGIFILIAVATAFAALGGIAAVNIKKKIRY